MSKTRRALTSGCMILGLMAALTPFVLAGAVALGHDAVAKAILEHQLKARGFACDTDDLDVDLDPLNLDVRVKPVRCVSTRGSSLQAVVLESDALIELEDLKPKSVYIERVTLQISRAKVKAKPAEGTSKLPDALLKYDPRPSADALALALSRLPNRRPIRLTAPRVLVEVDGELEAELQKVDVIPEFGAPLLVKVRRGHLATRDAQQRITPKNDWVAFVRASAEIDPESIDGQADLEVAGFKALTVTANVSNLKAEAPRWKLGAKLNL